LDAVGGSGGPGGGGVPGPEVGAGNSTDLA